ncbi:MAG: sulfite exporter TauE/SafE family protein [Chitinophagales bacterium]|nr:sulfite exporter TauE/SafE family protein [Chitinophagales bacterium]
MLIALFVLLAIVAEIIGTVGGFGSSLFFVPVAQFFFDMKTVLGITAVFHVFSNLVKLILFRKTIDLRLTLLFGIPSILFVILGAWLATKMSFRFDQIILAVFLIVFSSILLAFPDLKVRANAQSSVLGGSVAGLLAGYIGTGGAIRGLSLAAYNLEKNLFVGTSAAIDMGVDLSRSIIYVKSGFITKENYYLIPMLVVVSVVGSYIGKLLLGRINQESFRKIVLSLILIIGIVMLIRSAIPFVNAQSFS